MPDADRASDVVTDFIKQVVADEDARKASIEQRGLAVVTTISALVGIGFALVASITSSTTFSLPTSTHGPLLVTVVLFGLAAIAGIASTSPFRYKEANADELRDVVEHWNGATTQQGQTLVSLTRLDIYVQQRVTNGRKALFLLIATCGEVIGIGFLMWAVADILTHAH